MLFTKNSKILKLGTGSQGIVLSKPLQLIKADKDKEVVVSVEDNMIKIKKIANETAAAPQ